MSEKETKEIKEITTANERWCKIKKLNMEIVVSSPYKSDKMKDIVEYANKLANEHSLEKSKPGYCE